MKVLVNLNGVIVPPEEAQVSVFDRGFLYGDSIYETLRTYRGTPFLLEPHLDRLARSSEKLRIPLPGGRDGVSREISRSLASSDNEESSVRVMISRGAQIGVVDLDLDTAADPTLVILVRPFVGFPPPCYSEGVDVALVSVRRTGSDALDPSIKSGNYLNNILALGEARDRKAFECLMLNQRGRLTEASTSNVFLVKQGVVRTPSLECGLLDGITRRFLIDVTRAAEIEVHEEELTADDLTDADEIFLTSSLKEVMPVRSVDGRPVGTGRPGLVTQKLHALYLAAADRAIDGRPDSSPPNPSSDEE